MLVNPTIRTASPTDYDVVAPLVDAWWGKPILGSLPRLFLDLFYRTSLVIDGTSGPAAVLVGILSPSDAETAYIHFVGVAPPDAAGAMPGCCMKSSSVSPALPDVRASARSRPR
jgi:hypothetical protein